MTAERILDKIGWNNIVMNLLKIKTQKKPRVVIERSGASTLDILEVLLSQEGRRRLGGLAEFAVKLNLRKPKPKTS
jgi:hypothetical protein